MDLNTVDLMGLNMYKKEIKKFVDQLPSDVRFGMLLILDAQYGRKYQPVKGGIPFKRKR